MTPPTDWDAEARLWARARNVLVASMPREWKAKAALGDAVAQAKWEGYGLAVLVLSERERAAREMAAHLKELAAA